jgi:hypothetical protein
MPDKEASDDEDSFLVKLLNPICEDEVFVPTPNEVKVNIINDLISNQVGFKVKSTKVISI